MEHGSGSGIGIGIRNQHQRADCEQPAVIAPSTASSYGEPALRCFTHKAAVPKCGGIVNSSLHQSRARSSALQHHVERPCTDSPSTQHPPNCPAFAIVVAATSTLHHTALHLWPIPYRRRYTSEDHRLHSDTYFFAFSQLYNLFNFVLTTSLCPRA